LEAADLVHLALDFPCPALSSAGDGLFVGHAGKVGHVAESRVGGRGWAKAVIPFALWVADGSDLAGSWLIGRGCRSIRGVGAACRGHGVVLVCCVGWVDGLLWCELEWEAAR